MTDSAPPPSGSPHEGEDPPSSGTSGMGFSRAWSALSRAGKVIVCVGGGLLVVFALAGLAGGGETQTTTVTEQVAAVPDEATGETVAMDEVEPPEAPVSEPAPAPDPEVDPQPAAAPSPAPQVFNGSGRRVITVDFPTDGSPTMVEGSHRGSSNFIVGSVSGFGFFNEIGNYKGAVLNVDDSGRQRVNVQADGPWTLKFTKVVPRPRAPVVPRTFNGQGAEVIQLRADGDQSLLVDLRHRGESNFIVGLVPLEGQDVFGSLNLANEIGTYEGQTAIDLPSGGYALSVAADGNWSVSFSP